MSEETQVSEAPAEEVVPAEVAPTPEAPAEETPATPEVAPEGEQTPNEVLADQVNLETAA